jgi:hypothetical protein
MSSDVRASTSASQRLSASKPRTTGNHAGANGPEVPQGTGRALSLVIIALTVGLAVMWSLAMRHQLTSSIVRESAGHLDRARRAFDLTRSRMLDSLRIQARVMVEDPRLKSTLATSGIDEATVTDILRDLGKLRGTGVLLILSPDGRVFAQAGADELRGLDLSGSTVVKKAQGTREAVAGSWVIGGKIMDLSVTPVRFGPNPIAYLVVGQAVDQDMLNAVADQTGVAVATTTGQTIMLAAPPEDGTKAVLAAVLGQLDSSQSRLFAVNGETYIAAISELEESGQTRPRLLVTQQLARTSAAFATTKWMIFVPPVLVIIAVLFALAAGRRIAVVRQP